MLVESFFLIFSTIYANLNLFGCGGFGRTFGSKVEAENCQYCHGIVQEVLHWWILEKPMKSMGISSKVVSAKQLG